jgi:hypothetical protein
LDGTSQVIPKKKDPPKFKVTAKNTGTLGLKSYKPEASSEPLKLPNGNYASDLHMFCIQTPNGFCLSVLDAIIPARGRISVVIFGMLL